MPWSRAQVGPSPGVQGELRELHWTKGIFSGYRGPYGGLFVPDQDSEDANGPGLKSKDTDGPGPRSKDANGPGPRARTLMALARAPGSELIILLNLQP